MLVVEPAAPRDLQKVGRIVHETLQERYSPEWLAQHHATDPDDFLVAREVETGDVVGVALAERREPCEGHVLALAVETMHQGEGLGTALLRRLQNRLRNGGAYQITLEVRVDDLVARRFYERHGYRPAGILEHAYSDGSDALRLVRTL